MIGPLVAFPCPLESEHVCWKTKKKPKFSLVFPPHGCGLRLSDPGGLALWPPWAGVYLLFLERRTRVGLCRVTVYGGVDSRRRSTWAALATDRPTMNPVATDDDDGGRIPV